MMMEDKFKDVPVDEETKIIFESKMKFDNKDILYQKWIWDGIMGESIIFYFDDVKELNDEEFVNYIKSSDIVADKSSITIAKSKDEKYRFANFNFVTEYQKK
jgi:hypothetical protein